MALRWFATAPIYVNRVRAFNPTDYVPDPIVESLGLVSQGLVAQVDVPAEDPAVVLRPLTSRDVDTDAEREVFVPSRLSSAALRAAFDEWAEGSGIGGGGVTFTDNGDGTYALSGSAIADNGDGTYTIAA